MNNYNINMKKFNGTDYDNLLPLAYNALNSQQLDGKTFNEIQTLFTSTDLYLYTSNYIGTRAFGEAVPTTITFPFEPIILFMPVDPQHNTPSIPIPTSKLSSEGYVIFSLYSQQVFIKMSSDRKTVMYYGGDYFEQFNIPSQFYPYAAIGGYDRGQVTEYLIAQSGTWTVPKTGRYYIELYGGGGYGVDATNTELSGLEYLGGSSCQTYNAITLNKGEAISVVIGTYGDRRTGKSATGTQFGSYSVAAGGNATSTSGGVGSGNKGTTLQETRATSANAKNPNNGRFGDVYGYGSGRSIITGAGAVYLKYLGD